MSTPFIKRLIYLPTNDEGQPLVLPIHASKQSALDKLASHPDLLPKVAEFIGTLKPDPDYRHILVNAMGAGEYYSCNKNGDWFGEDVLKHAGDKYGHKTFLKAGCFTHHLNSRMEKSGGQVVLSEWNPEMKRVELILKIAKDKDPRAVEMIDDGVLYPLSMGCFSPGAQISMGNGTEKHIEKIEIGDEVLNSSGKKTVVKELSCRPYSGKLYKVRTANQDEVGVTGNHPYLIISREKTRKYACQNSFNRDMVETLSLSDAEWVHASCLKEGDFAITPINTDASGVPISVAQSRLLGYYLAEGHILKNKKKERVGIQLTVGIKDAVHEEIEELCAKIGTKNAPAYAPHNTSDKACYIYIHDRVLAEFCFKHAGAYAKSKILSEEVMSWPVDLQLNLIGAYLNGDGCQSKGFWQKGTIHISTANELLANQVVKILARCGILANVNTINHTPSEKSLVRIDTTEYQIDIGKTFVNKIAPFCKAAEIELKNIGCNQRRIVRGNFIISPIRSVKESTLIYNGPVYNFEVEDGESYVANGAVVHNCKVSHDICSICNHKSKTANSYCEHLRPGGDPGMGIIIDEGEHAGKVACALNPDPNFFDISRVLVPADRTAQVYGKVASVGSYPEWFFMPSGLLAVKMGDVKEADIEKEIPASVSALEKTVDNFKDKIDRKGHTIALEDLKKCAQIGGLRPTLSAFAALGIPMNPIEFQTLVLMNTGHEKAASDLYSLGYQFEETERTPKKLSTSLNLKLNDVTENPVLLKIAGKYLETKSVLQPYVLNRFLEKKAFNYKWVPLQREDLEPIAGLYSAYLDKLAAFGPEGLRKAAKIPEVQFLLARNFNLNPLELNQSLYKAAEDGGAQTIKDFVTGTLLSPRYKPSLDMVKSTDPSHLKLASALSSELTSNRTALLDPDTYAWVTVLTVNSVNKET